MEHNAEMLAKAVEELAQAVRTEHASVTGNVNETTVVTADGREVVRCTLTISAMYEKEIQVPVPFRRRATV